MSEQERFNLVAPCGIDCGRCEVYLCKDNQQMLDYFVSRGIPKEKLPCGGCRDIKGFCPVIGGQCATYDCVEKKNVDFCFNCEDFPCSKLNPASDRADVLPHNCKVFNLCTIKREGVKGFIALSGEIKKKYFKGKMEIGKGPQSTD